MSSSDERSQGRPGDVPPLFATWMHSFGVTEIVAPLLRTVSVWASYCSPSHASAQSMATAHADLALWFFYLDDYDGDDYESLFDDCLRILDGNRPTMDRPSLMRAYADVVDQVASHGHDPTCYLQSRCKSVEQIRQRIRFSKSPRNKRVTFEEYYAQRMVSVYVYQWMDMWEIIGDFYLDSQERMSPEVAEAKRAVTAWHILQNDMRSLRRDIDSGSPNLVLLHAEQKTARIEETVGIIRDLFREELENFQRASQSLLRSMPSLRVRRYIDLLDICLTGGEKSFWEIKERYDWDTLQQLLRGLPAASV